MGAIDRVHNNIDAIKLYNDEKLLYHTFVDNKDHYTKDLGEALLWAMKWFWQGYRDIRVYAEVLNKDEDIEEEYYIWGIGGLPC